MSTELNTDAVILKFHTVEVEQIEDGPQGLVVHSGHKQLQALCFDAREYIPNAPKLNVPLASLSLTEMGRYLKDQGFVPHPLRGGVWVLGRS